MRRATNREAPCDWRVVKVDWKAHCGDEWVAEKGIESCGVFYVLDANLHVHICSFTPVLEAWPVLGYATFVSEEAYDADEGETETEMLNTEEEDYRRRVAEEARDHFAGDPCWFGEEERHGERTG